METTQAIIRGMMEDQRRIGAKLLKLAQRETGLHQELRAARAEIDRLQRDAETVEQRVAEAHERMQFAITGATALPDSAYAHDLFECWDERWESLGTIALGLRDRAVKGDAEGNPA